jgi:hypothetical protein
VAGVPDLGAIGRGEDMEITSYLEEAMGSELQGLAVAGRVDAVGHRLILQVAMAALVADRAIERVVDEVWSS